MLKNKLDSYEDPEEALAEVEEESKDTQWVCIENLYWPAKPTIPSLPPGVYRVMSQFGELRLMKEELNIEGVFPTGSSNAKEIMADFDKFWDSEEKFRKYEVPFKRGTLLSGPPGSGKTCIIKLLADKMINERKGFVLDLKDCPYMLDKALDAVSEIHPDVPVLAVFEDIGHYYYEISQSLLNIMDGLKIVDRVMFVATTNNINDLDEAIVNRPGRFDTHFRILPAQQKARKDFILSLMPEDEVKDINIESWMKDTKGLPFGHIKELVLSVRVFGKDYRKTLERLRNLKEGQGEDEEAPELN